MPPACRAAGLYLVAVATFFVAAIVVLVLSSPSEKRQDDFAVLVEPAGSPTVELRTLIAGLTAVGARAALAVLVASNLVMVAVMAVAPVHLHAGGMTLETIGIVVSLHVAGMFAPAPVWVGWPTALGRPSSPPQGSCPSPSPGSWVR